MHTQEEILDLVDENDNVVGSMSRSEIYKSGLKNFRAINVFLKNSKGQLWIPRRVATKKLFPLCLDMSVGGHVESGEEYDAAFKREVFEELRLNVDNLEYSFLGKLTPFKDGTSAFMKVYEIATDDIPDYNLTDYFEYYWLKPDDILKKIESGDGAKDDLKVLIKKFYS